MRYRLLKDNPLARVQSLLQANGTRHWQGVPSPAVRYGRLDECSSDFSRYVDDHYYHYPAFGLSDRHGDRRAGYASHREDHRSTRVRGDAGRYDYIHLVQARESG